jgi:hypothetical protein
MQGITTMDNYAYIDNIPTTGDSCDGKLYIYRSTFLLQVIPVMDNYACLDHLTATGDWCDE